MALTALTSGVANAETKQAVLAGGCFWCIEHDLEVLGGVEDVKSGYAGGEVENPTYEQVSSGTTGHYEVVQVTYDSDKISYAQLLDAFVENVDPFDSAGQFCDKGQQYKAAIFTSEPAERALAKEKLDAIRQKFGKEPTILLLDSATFYPAEDYHQDYSEKNPMRYKFYRWNCGRDQRLEQVWDK